MSSNFWKFGFLLVGGIIGFCGVLLVRERQLAQRESKTRPSVDLSQSRRGEISVGNRGPLALETPSTWRRIWELGPSKFRLEFPVLDGLRIAPECARLLELTPAEEAILNQAISDALKEIEEHARNTLLAEELSGDRVALVVPKVPSFSAALQASFGEKWLNVLGPERLAVMSSSLRYRSELLRAVRYFGNGEQVCVLYFGPDEVRAEIALNRFAPFQYADRNPQQRGADNAHVSEVIPLRSLAPFTAAELNQYLGHGWQEKLPARFRGLVN